MPQENDTDTTVGASPDPEWLTQLRAWEANGTLDRLWSCTDTRETVKVERSSGNVQDARVHALTHRGRGVVVAFMTPVGERFRNVATEDFLILNPQYSGAGS